LKLIAVPRPKLIRVKARAETQSFLVSLNFHFRVGNVFEKALVVFVGLTFDLRRYKLKQQKQ